MIPLLGLLVLPAAVTSAQPPPRPAALDPRRALVFEANLADAGEWYQFGTAVAVFRFDNRGAEPVELLSVHGRAPGAEAEIRPRRVPPGGRGEVRLTQELGPRLGLQRFTYEVSSDDDAQAVQRLTLIAFVQSAYDVERPFLDFGYVSRAAGATLELEVTSREVERLRLVGVDEAPAFVAVEQIGRSGVAGEGLRLRATLAPGAPRGLHVAALLLRTDLPLQSRYMVGLQAAVFDRIVPDPPQYRLGAVRRGESFESEVRLLGREGHVFTVLGVDDPSGTARGSFARCDAGPADAPADCWTVRLALPARHEGVVRGEARVRIAGDPEPLPLVYSGLVAAPDARIDDLGELDAETRERRIGGGDSR